MLGNKQVQLQIPPALRYRCVIFLVLLVSWSVVAVSLWDGWEGMALLNWVGTIFGGIIGLMVALPRSQLFALEQEQRVGNDGQWLDFSLDMQLSEPELAVAVALLELKAGELHPLSPSIYRFGFKRAWHGRRALLRQLEALQPV